MDLRTKVLLILYRLFPFPLRGDCALGEADPDYRISCLINFYGRPHLLRNILSSLAEQNFPKRRFEVVLVEDREGTPEGSELVEGYRERLNVRYFTLKDNFGQMGYARNFALSNSRGKYILLLDDDTVILQRDFLTTLLKEFDRTHADALIPHGFASFCRLKGRYQFHDPYYPTSRCVAYSREALGDLCGYVSDITGQEDVEFTIRFLAAGKRAVRSASLEYLHPPLIVEGLGKPRAVGASFAKLRSKYPFPVWLMLLLNGARHLPLLLFPFNRQFLMQGRFALGFILGALFPGLGGENSYT